MKNVKLLCSLFAALLLSGSMWATQVNVATTAELQTALDNATEGTEIIVAAGTYDVVKLQNNGANANRIMKDVTIKAATGATVKIAQIAYQPVSGKSLDIENLTIDGFEFNVPEKTGVLFDENGGYLRVNGLTVQNCKKVGNKSNGTTYDNAAFFGGYYDGTTAINATFNGNTTLTRGYHDIKILNNTIEKVLQPIKFPNDGPLYGLTVTGNSFIDCQDNHFMLSTKTTGTVTITDNTIDQMTGRFARISGAQAAAEFTITGNKVTNPQMFDTGGDGSIVKITGAAGFSVTDNTNDWLGSYTSTTTWIAYPTMVTDGTGQTYANATSEVNALLGKWKESTPTTLTIKRNIYKDGYYNTLCLPFDLTNDQIVATFGTYKELKEFISAEVQGEGASREIILNLKDTTGIMAGEAYLITFEAGETLTQLVFSGVTVTTTTATAESGDLVYQGILAPYQMPYENENYLFVGEQNKLYWAINDGTFMKGFRAYFKVTESQSSPYRFGMKASFGSKNTPTGNANVNANANEIKKLIENGRVFIMNNGVKYDMNGKVVE